MFKTGDIVLNFKTNKIYYFDSNFEEHRKYFFSSRIATIDEAEKFTNLKVGECHFRDLGILADFKRKNKYWKEIELKLIVSPEILLNINRLMYNFKIKTYSDLFYLLLQNNKLEYRKEIDNQNDNYREKFFSLKKSVNQIFDTFLNSI